LGYSPYKKELLFILKLLPVSIVPAVIFAYYVIKTIPPNAESHEDQEDSKQNFVGATTAKLRPIFCLGVVKNTENENHRFKSC